MVFETFFYGRFLSGSWWYDHFLVPFLQQSWCRLERPFCKRHTLYQVFRSLLWEATIFNFHNNWRKFIVLCCTRSPFTAERISKLINKPPRRVVDHRRSHKLRCPAHLETDIKEHQEQQEEWELKRSGTSSSPSLPTKFQEKVMKLNFSHDLLIPKSFLMKSLWPNCKVLKTAGSLYRSPCRAPVIHYWNGKPLWQWWVHMKRVCFCFQKMVL